MDLYERAQTACPPRPARYVRGDCIDPKTRWKHANGTSLFAAGRRRHRTEFSGPDIALDSFNHVRAAPTGRKIPCHLAVPFIHSLDVKPCCECNLVLVGKAGDRVFERRDRHPPSIMARGIARIHMGRRSASSPAPYNRIARMDQASYPDLIGAPSDTAVGRRHTLAAGFK